MNLVALVQFFDITCVTILDHLIASGRQDSFLRPISHHYSIVEINGHSMFHLYCML